MAGMIPPGSPGSRAITPTSRPPVHCSVLTGPPRCGTDAAPLALLETKYTCRTYYLTASYEMYSYDLVFMALLDSRWKQSVILKSLWYLTPVLIIFVILIHEWTVLVCKVVCTLNK